MTRKSTSNGADHDETGPTISPEQMMALLKLGTSSNVPDDVMIEFEGRYVTLKTAADAAKKALDNHCDEGEDKGIDIVVFKDTMKLKKKTAPEARHRMQTRLRYAVQLGLFAAIEANDQDESNADNLASVNSAEKANGKAKPKGGAMAAADAAALEDGAGKLTIASEQGLRAGLDGAKSKDNPYDKKTHPTKREYWAAQFKVGAEQRKSVGEAPARPVGSEPASQPADA